MDVSTSDGSQDFGKYIMCLIHKKLRKTKDITVKLEIIKLSRYS